MWETYREWIRFYCYVGKPKSYVGRVYRKAYEAYLKRNGYEDKHHILTK